METRPLPVELPRIDCDTQSRKKINEDVVQDYCDLISASGIEWPFPPLDVFHDGTDYFVADGFHRLLGALRSKRGTIPCNIHPGTAMDAHIFGMTANDRHGLRMTKEDKKYCVDWLLDCGTKMTQAEIAEKAGVSRRTVQMIVADRKPDSIAGKTKCQKAQIAPDTPIRGGDDSGEADDSEVIPEEDAQGLAMSRSPDGAPKGKKCTCGADWWFDGACGGCFAPEDSGKDGSSPGKAKDSDSRSPRKGKETPADFHDPCPVCAGKKWLKSPDGAICAKCSHPHGEPAGEVDNSRLGTQRQKTVKTCESLMRAFDDLQAMLAKPYHDDVIKTCKSLLAKAKNWK